MNATAWPVARPWIGTVARLLLGVVWIWASLSKLGDPRQFAQAVRAYQATPEWLAKAIGYGLPVLELGLGIVLVVGITVRIAAAVSGLLFVVFLIGLIQAAARGISLTCGCFGGGGTTEGSTSYTLDILRDLGLLVVAAYLVLWPLTRLSLEEFLARHDRVVMPSAKRMRTPEGRKRYEAQVAMSRATARNRGLWVDGSISAVIVLVAVIGIGVQAGRAKVSGVVEGVHATIANGVVYGKSAAATVDVFEDFGCPVCEEFEKESHAKLQADARANLVQIRYHPISILDRSSPNQYSTRAANAAICVSDAGVNQFIAYHNLLYGSPNGKQWQPVEGTAGPTDAELIALGRQVGLTSSQQQTLSTCVTSQQYKPYVEQATEKASERGVSGTPTLFVNGKKLADFASSTLFGAIAKADKGHTPSPSPTPSPSSPSSTPSSTSAVPTKSSSTSPTKSSSTSAAP